MKLQVLSMTGEMAGEVEAPKAFSEKVRKDLIIRAVRSELSKTFQPKAPLKVAGLQTSAEYIGVKDAYRTMKNRGTSRLPHEKFPKGRYGRVRMVPFAVTGRRAHPPKVEKILVEKMNKKEYRKALDSAIAASANAELVRLRTGGEYKVPYVVVDDVESLKKTKDVIKMLESLGLLKEVEKSERSRKRITGVRKKRLARAYKVRKSVLFVVSKECSLLNSAASIAGAKAVKVEDLKVSDLAPGGLPGRLVVWSKGAISKLGELNANN
ncbi:MAG: 50S ribosomal protein L4 [Candidatus Micrarchaeota archaeon]|nr:50S ribosomal protein L4 [Candidatus Micrarchaeota archaeon]